MTVRIFRPSFESLERRLALSAGAVFHVNTSTASDQTHSDNASSTNGIAVAVWEHAVTQTNHDLYGQLYKADGSKLGGQFLVANGVRNQTTPKVAMESHGKFVVVWCERTGVGQGDIRARRFDATGHFVGGIIDIAKSTLDESSPSVAMVDKAGATNDGEFVVTYQSNGASVVAKMYSKFGFVQKTLDIGGPHAANAPESLASVSRSANGSFVVGYAVVSPPSRVFDPPQPVIHSVYFDRFDAKGNLLGRLLEGNHTFLHGLSLSMDDFGNTRYAVAYNVTQGQFEPVYEFISVNYFTANGQRSTPQGVYPTTVPSEVKIVSNKRDSGYALFYVQSDHTGNPQSILYERNSKGVAKRTDLGFRHAEIALSIGKNNRYFLTYTTTVSTQVDPGKGIFGRFGVV